ncbi:MAG: 5'-methylthioadenosine/S-adenosylhomocysteine nucleosidase [Kiritimatiellia bacterium]
MSLRKVFVVAMDNEAAAVTAHLADASEETVFGRRIVRGTLGGERTAVVISGIGKTNAAAAAQLALSLFNPEVLLNVGVAGALHAPMRVAEVYRVRAAVQYDFDLAQINGTKVGTLNEYKDRELPLDLAGNVWPEALLATGDRFNDSEVDHRFLVDDVKADLRDMEGAALAHVACRAGVKFRSIKSVSDVAGSGSTTDQYLANLAVALASLSAAVPAFFSAD